MPKRSSEVSLFHSLTIHLWTHTMYHIIELVCTKDETESKEDMVLVFIKVII